MKGICFGAFSLIRFFVYSIVFFQFLPDMGNDVTKPNWTNAKKPPDALRKASDKIKHVLLLYKPWTERAGDIMQHFYDAFNEVKPAGAVEISSENAVDVSKHNDEYVRKRTSQWLMNRNNVVLLCFPTTQAEHFSRKDFIDDSGKLSRKIYSVAFGTEIPSQWPDCYSLGIADPEKVERPNDFESDGLEVLAAAIR